MAVLLALFGEAWAADPPPPVRYDFRLAAQPTGDLLQAIAKQTGSSLLFDPSDVQGLSSPSISGRLSAEEAVTRALQGTRLVLTVQRDGALVVKPGPAAARGVTPPAPQSAASSPTSLGRSDEPARRVAQADNPPTTDAGPSQVAHVDTSKPQKVEITGSRLRLLDSESALPVNVYSRAEIERSGQPSLGQFLASLNEASMGQGEGSFSGASQGQGTVQLRGLPLGSTLVLINGRRVQAVGSSSANFFNLNLIPLAAVERVEVVPVGSSAVYGGDALAGVVNVILRKSIDGQSFSARVASGKGFGDGGFSIAAGDSGERGAWMALASFTMATPLLVKERAFFRDADYRRFGGTDTRVRNCTPGTVTSTTTANLPGLNSTFAAIPVVGAGERLTVQSFAATAGQANLCNGLANSGAASLVHGSESLSIHTGGQWNVSQSLVAFGELTFVQEKVQADGLGLNFNNILVPASNPNNPFGVAVRVTARLGPENGIERYTRDTDFTRTLVGLRGDFGRGWDFETTASVSRDSGDRLLVNNIVYTTARTNALATTNAAASLNPFTSGRAASDDVLRSIWSDSVRKNFGRKEIVSGFVRGPIVDLPAGPLDAIIGAETARDDYETILPDTKVINTRRSSAAYGELRLPLWSSSVTGERSWPMVALTLAGRRDHYSDFGSANTYQGGLELRPIRNLLVRASAATSFKPPTLLQTNVDDLVFPIEAAALTDPARGNAPVVGGEWIRTTNRNLQPEKGKAYALGAIWEPGGSPGSRFGFSAWRVRIDGLIGILAPQLIVNNESLFPGWVVRGPSVGGLPGPITRLIWAESNFGFVETRGFDLEAAQSWNGPIGRWSVGASATHATEYSVVITPGAPVADRLGRRYSEYWAPKWKGRLTAGLDEGAWSVGITSRYLGSYKDLGTSDRSLGNTWVHDLSGRLNLNRLGLGLGAARNASLSLAIVNLTNKLPEFAAGSPYYDTSQGDWRGRFASVRFSVDW